MLTGRRLSEEVERVSVDELLGDAHCSEKRVPLDDGQHSIEGVTVDVLLLLG